MAAVERVVRVERAHRIDDASAFLFAFGCAVGHIRSSSVASARWKPRCWGSHWRWRAGLRFSRGAGGRYLALPLYAPLAVMMWAALRFGWPDASVTLSIVTFAAIWSVDRGTGSFPSAQPDEKILALQVFVLFTAVPVLALSASVTARRRAQMEIDEQRRAISHLARVSVLGQLSGAFAHELNQPLAAILTNAQAASLGAPAPACRHRRFVRDSAGHHCRQSACRGCHRSLRALLKRGELRFGRSR